MESLDPVELGKAGNYFLLTSILVPRPIGWLGTRSVDGVDNLAPFSYFMGVSSEPALVAVSVARGRRGELKDTARNLLETEVGTLNLVSSDLLEAMHQSSAAYGPEISEFEVCGLRAVPAELVEAPFVGEARSVMEVRVHSYQDLGSVHLFVLQVLRYHLQDGLLEDGRAPIHTLDAVARLGGTYALLGREQTLPRPKVD